MDELRAAESIRYLANQYVNMQFVAEQLEKIGSLKGQIESLIARQVEISLAVDEKSLQLDALKEEEANLLEEHRLKMEQLAREYSEQSAALQSALEEQQVRQDVTLRNRLAEHETIVQQASDAHQVRMADLNAQLVALGERVAAANEDALEAEARRDRAQQVVNKLQSTIEAIKFQGVDA